MKGSYALVLRLPVNTGLTVGRLGDLHLPPGYCLYFGSALNGLESRLRRHLAREKKQHWHIDFLTAVAQIVQIWWAIDDQNKECSWTQRSLENAGTSVPAPGFGSSDCRACPAHLVHVPSWSEVQQVRGQLESDSTVSSLQVSDGRGSRLFQAPKNLVS